MNRGQAVNVPVPDFTEPERELVVALLQERIGVVVVGGQRDEPEKLVDGLRLLAAEKAAAEAQDKADLELGRKVREHNVIEKAREADEKLKAIRKAANRLAQKHGEKGWDEDAS